jgi:hypothetical protein
MQKNIIRIALVIACLLLIPVIGKWPWTSFDFVFAGVLLFGTGLAYILIASRAKSTQYRFAVGISVVTALLLVWINGAVGIIGSEDNPANLLYGAVLLVGFIGTLIAQLKPRGMSNTLYAVAVVQLLVPVAALMIWRPDFDPGVVQVFMLNAVFAALWAGAAILFRHADAAASSETLHA